MQLTLNYLVNLLCRNLQHLTLWPWRVEVSPLAFLLVQAVENFQTPRGECYTNVSTKKNVLLGPCTIASDDPPTPEVKERGQEMVAL